MAAPTLSLETPIYAILIILGIVVSIGGIYFLYNKYVLPLAKPDFESLPSDQKNILETEFNNFITKANECRQKPTPIGNCICKNVLPNFPLNLAKDIKLNISQGGNAEVTLLFNDKLTTPILKGTINNAQFSYITYQDNIPRTKGLSVVGGILDFDKEKFIVSYIIQGYFGGGIKSISSDKILTNHLVRSDSFLSLTTMRGLDQSQTAYFEGLLIC